VRRFGSVPALLVALAALTALAGCSSSDKANVPPATTTSTTRSTTSTTVRIEPGTVPTTGGGGTTPTTAAPNLLLTFTTSPSSPVECNAPTMIELAWTAAPGVKSVDLTIDGTHAATFAGGRQNHLEYFACDGKKHTYALSAKVGTTTDTAIAEVTSKPPS
jgi:hypothetical protein